MKFKTIVASIFLTALSITAQAQEFPGLTEGKDYIKSEITNIVVDGKQSKPVLVEFFWYGCPHCYSMKPMSEALAKKYGNKIEYVRYPVGFSSWESGGRIFFTLEQMKLLDKLHDKTFDQIQKNRVNILGDKKERDKFYEKEGIDIKKFNDIYSSFSVSAKWNKAKTMVESHNIQGSPNFAVYSNGYTYQVAPGFVGNYVKTIQNLDKILATKTK